MFSCPPYADLERYSDDPRDLSTMGYPDFLRAYGEAVAASLGMLRDNRFAAFVVGDVRDERGVYRNLVGATVDAFGAADARLYNDAVLVTAIASLSLRAAFYFAKGSRKLGRAHQQMLVFVKGDPKEASRACGDVDA